jgi:hypothetical protein
MRQHNAVGRGRGSCRCPSSFEDEAAAEAHALGRLPSGVNDGLRGVVRVRGRCPGAGELVLGQQRIVELLTAVLPIRLEFFRERMAEGVRHAAPADIAREYTLFGQRRAPAFGFDLLEGFDGRDVVAVFDALRALAEFGFVRDAVVDRRDARRLLGLYIG